MGERTDGQDLAGVLRVIGRRERPGTWRLEGELDFATRDLLVTALGTRSGPGDVCLDAAGLSFVDCAGLGTLVELAHQARAAGHRFEITRASGALTRLIGLTGLTELLS